MKKNNFLTTPHIYFGILLAVSISICLLFSSIFYSPQNAQKLSPEISKKENPQETEIREKAFTQVINTAREKGIVRVIIGLRMDNFKPIGDLSRADLEKQKTDIKTVQENFIEDFKDYNLKEIKQFDFIPFLAAEVDLTTLEKMRQDDQVVSIQEDEALAPTLAESVPLIGAPAAWNSGYTGLGWSVAVLDTGVDKTHPFLSGKVASEACYSTTNTASGISSVCPGGATASTASGSGVNCSLSVSGCNHGTHVAGIAAGTNASMSGVAKNANVIAVQVFSRFDNQTNCGTTPAPCALSYPSDQIRGLERVLALSSSMNIASVNMSLGGGQYTSNCDSTSAAQKAAIDNLRSVGVATVIASGNNGYTNAISSPACISTAVSVGSTGDGSSGSTTNAVSSFSNSATMLNLLAPGQVIYSSVPGGVYGNMQGTSMATPHVAGAWAVLKQRAPTATVTQVLNALTTTGLSITDARNNIVKPRIRVDAAVQALVGCSSSTISVGQTINGTLQSGDCLYPSDSSYYDAYTFSGTAGQQIYVSMNSTQFDTYLFLVQGSFPGGTTIASDNDGGGGTNARIPATSGLFTLPATGTYTILANSLSSGMTGAYSLTLGTTVNCTYSATPNVQNFAATGGGGGVSVSTQTGCSWTAVSNTPSWITITSGSSGNGSNPVVFNVANNTGAFRTGTMTVAGQTITVNQAAGTVQPTAIGKHFDFDGDRKTDVGIFRPSNGQWWYLRSTDSSSRAFEFGTSSDIRVPADFTGDGKVDIAFWRPSTGQWFVLRSENSSFYGYQFGQSGDIPTTGDFDRDGKADSAIYRPSNGGWYILLATGGVISQQFGISEDKPVVADYDGDGKDDIAIFRPSSSQWWILKSTGGVYAAQFGATGDKTVQGDYTGDGKADIAFWRPSNGFWYILRSEDSSFYGFPFGSNGDMPAPGDYDGDGKHDAAVFRPSNSAFYMQRTTAGFNAVGFGTSGDQPIANAYVR